jgi:periplasmic protein TonB
MRQLTTIILTLLTLTSFGQDKDSTDTTNYIFVSEPMPSYPGGHAEMIKFIKRNLKYPRDSRTVQGKVYVEFVVNENGSLSDIRVVKGLVDSLDNSALEIVKKMPKWIPAKRDDKPIRTKMVIAISFD